MTTTTASSPIVSYDQLVKEYAGNLQALEWQRIIRANLAKELLVQQGNAQIMGGLLGVLLHRLGGLCILTVAEVQAFDALRLQPVPTFDPIAQQWTVRLVEKKA